MAAFSGILFAAPCLGPLMGGYLTISTSDGFRAMWWLLFALCGFFALVSTFFLVETYHPALLKKRAKKLRAEGKSDVMTEQEREARPLAEIARETLLRPLGAFRPFSPFPSPRLTLLSPSTVMLTTEPIMMLFAGYLGLIYSLLYSSVSLSFLVRALPTNASSPFQPVLRLPDRLSVPRIQCGRNWPDFPQRPHRDHPHLPHRSPSSGSFPHFHSSPRPPPSPLSLNRSATTNVKWSSSRRRFLRLRLAFP
jgi:MFS family permease